MTPELAALLAAGATTVVSAAATDAWGLARAGFGRLLGRGDAGRESAEITRLDALAAAVEQAPVEERDDVRQRRRNGWLVRLGDLVEDDPAAVQELHGLVEELTPRLPQARWVQHNTARDHGQVFAALGGNVIVHQTPPGGA
jgi:hypothetical protein